MPDIGGPLDDAFSSLTSSQPSTASASSIVIDGNVYLVDTESGMYKREGIDVVQQRNTSDSRDLLLLPQDVWRQMSQSWHQGAGQSNVDRDEALPYRYADSFGIDPWERWEVSLLPSTAALTGTPTDDSPMFLAVHNGSLVIGAGSVLSWYSDSVTKVTLTPSAANDIVSMTYDGDAVITLHADGKVYKSTDNATTSLFGTWAGGTFIAYVKDYLIIGIANVLKNITSGAAVTVYTSPVSGFRWVGACEGLTEIYLCGGAGERSVVHSVSVNAAGTALDPCKVAAMLPDGEIAYSIGGYLGFIFIGTNEGVRMGTLSTNTRVTSGALTMGAVIPTTAPVYCFEGQDRFVWYGNSSITSDVTPTQDSDLFPSTAVCGLGRLDLSTFTVSESTPAYANDLVALEESEKTVTAVATWNGKRVFAVRNGGVYLEQDVLMEAGWLTQGVISFSVEDIKTGLYMQAKWQPLDGSISFDLAYDYSGFTRVTTYTVADSVRSDNIPMNGTQFSRLAPRFVLRRSSDDTTLGPVMTRWEVRVSPIMGGASRWTLPIINRATVDIDGVEKSRNPLTEKNTLINLVKYGRMVTLVEENQAYQVKAKTFAWQPDSLTENGKAWQGLFVLVVEEVT